LAEILDWSNDRIGRIERGQQKITPQEIKKLGEALGLSAEEIGDIILREAGLSEIKISTFMQKTTREQQRFEIETHVAGICLRRRGQRIGILVAKRLATRELYPGKWECGGGQVRPGENFEEAIKRQMREEFGIEIKILSPISTYQILAPQLPQSKIPGIVFLCELKGYVDSDVRLNKKEFSEYKWIEEQEVGRVDFIDGIEKQINDALKIYKLLSPKHDTEAPSVK
jgi:8-oxo-dGTP pyrophosphatase MutT (NUDIX family)